MPAGIAHAFNRRKSDPPEEQNLWLSYRQSRHDPGMWFLEWRRTPTSPKPVAMRKARDVEVTLIVHIQRLEEHIANPLEVRPMRGLMQLKSATLKPWTPTKPT
jgi:hypothetical protein